MTKAVTPAGWNDPATAPKNGTMLHLLILPGQEELDAFTSFHDSRDPYETIGFNHLSDTTVDEWQFAGWDWCHDCITDGHGEVIGWLPFGKTPSPETNLRGYQERVAAAHHALFHDDPTDVAERVARFFEEAVETCQALGLTHYDADKLLNYTYDRPIGEPKKEIGAALLTLASLCVVAGYDLIECGEADLEKLQRPETIARIRAKRSTRHGRGPLPGFDPTATTEGSDNG